MYVNMQSPPMYAAIGKNANSAPVVPPVNDQFVEFILANIEDIKRKVSKLSRIVLTLDDDLERRIRRVFDYIDDKIQDSRRETKLMVGEQLKGLADQVISLNKEFSVS